MAGSGTRCSSLGTCMFDKRGSVDSVRVFFFGSSFSPMFRVRFPASLAFALYRSVLSYG